MRTRMLKYIITTAALMAAVPVFGQGRGGPQVTGPAPKTQDGKPDFSGLWQRPYTPDMSMTATDLNGKAYPLENPAADTGKAKGGGRGPRLLPYTEKGLANWKSYTPDQGDYTGACLPFGLMRSMNSPDPIQIMQSKEYLSLLYEQNTWFKVFPLDGRAHDTKKTSTWFGDSIGHWEGDTLVVKTTNFRSEQSFRGTSENAVITERFTRAATDQIVYSFTVDDPTSFTAKFTAELPFTAVNSNVYEYACHEGNYALPAILAGARAEEKKKSAQ